MNTPMNWYYVENGQQAGPVDSAMLTTLVSRGIIQPDTLVWHEGMANWVPYSEVAASQGAPPVAQEVGTPPAPTGAAPAGLVCCECGKVFAPDQVIRHGDKWVCASCKPIFLQRLREGVKVTGYGGAGQGMTTEADILARDYDVDIGACVSQGWELFKNNAGIMIGASLLVWLAMMGSGIIPYLGVILSLIFRGALMGGLWFFYIKKVRGMEATVGDAFSGFGPRFGQLFLTQLVPFLVAFAGAVIIVIFAVLAGALTGRGGFHRGGSPTPVFLIPIAVMGLIFVVVMVYVSVCWWYALPLVADKGMKFWPALELSRKVVNKHWWMNFCLMFVCGLLTMAGALACCVGVVVTGPTAFAAVTYQYEKMFGDLTPSQF